MNKLETSNWKKFKVKDIFEVKGSKTTKVEDLEEYGKGKYPYVTTKSINNGVESCYNFYTEAKNLITIDSAVLGIAFYQNKEFSASDHVEILKLKHKELNETLGLFLVTLINKENFRYNYGRKYNQKNIKNTIIKLPVDEKGNPDWEYMEEYIKELQERKNKGSSLQENLKTQNTKSNIKLNTEKWKEFYLHKLFNTSMGNGIDAIATTNDNPKYNYVSRDSNGNGVVDFIDEMEGQKPFASGTMSIALGGNFLGSCFIQKKQFYTAQNVGILQEKELLSIHTKLFVATLIRNECKIKFRAFGRELNSHFRKDFTIKLPILMNGDDYVFDKSKKYSDKGYIPDWEFMEKYIKSLPYGDKI